MQEAEKDKLQQQLRDALIAIKKLKNDLQKERYKQHEPIAIIGMAMRFPGGVNSAEDYWRLLENGVDAITDIPASRFDAAALYNADPDVPGKITVKQGGFLEGIDQFDGSFFDISPVEIESMDPQQRLLLEVTQEALENAGINVRTLVDSQTGVFIGVTNNDYQKRHFRSGDLTLINPYSYTGSAICSNSGRISYLMGLQGPSVSLDTACSSSLVATHLAAQSLRKGESDIAIAGAANVILDPEFTIYFSTLNALSSDSRCKPFANEANGFIRSEGCGIIVLKRLSDAQRDGDNILGVIKGSAVNQDGRSNGFTAPNVKAQERLLRAALKDAGLTPSQIGFIEAHGTGTKIGDPIEMEAIAGVFAAAKTKEHPLWVGSAKSNIGHTEGVAGMAGMMKALLAIQKGIVPKNLHFKTPNELIDWASLPIKVPVQSVTLAEEERYIGVSGFGVTGTNAHVILGPAPAPLEKEIIPLRKDVFVLPLSAKTPEALQALAKAYAAFIKISSASLEDICAMTALRRAPFEIREVFTARSKTALIELLEDFAEMPVEENKVFDADDYVKTVFICPGQGAQWVGMAQQLYDAEPVFKTALDECNAAFSKYVNWDLLSEIKSGNRFEEIDVIQPVLVAIEIALGELWKSKGIVPDIVIGHSMGEVAAAYLSGNISLDEAALIICTRSRLMKQTSGNGAMAVTDLKVEEAKTRIQGKESLLSVAVQNSPDSTVIAGDPAALEQLLAELEAEGRFCRKIKVDVASHSPQMEPLMEPLRQALQGIRPVDSNVLFYSTAQSKKLSGTSLNADYWVSNLRNPVQFGAVIREILAQDKAIFIEMSPHPVLLNAIQENIATVGKTGKGIASQLREKDELSTFYKAFGQYFSSGLAVDWTKIYPKVNEFVLLPNYQWQKERFWYDKLPQLVIQSGDASQKKECFYEIDWNAVAISEKITAKSILIIKDTEGIAEKLKTALEAKGCQVVMKGDNESLEGTQPEMIIHLRSIFNKTSFSYYPECGLISLQEIIRFYSEKKQSPKLCIVTNGSQKVVSGETDMNLNAALLWGLCRTVENEHPEFKICRVDIPFEAQIAPEEIIQAAFATGHYKELAIRNHTYFTPTLQKVKSSQASAPSFSSEETFLITGGTSGLGLIYAEWLADRGAKNICLMSRSGAKPETAPVLERLSAKGVKVAIVKADAADKESLAHGIMEAETELPPIKNVIHAAGILDDAALLNLSKEQFESVNAPKVTGAWNLHTYFESRDLNQFVLFSSGASVLGTAGQGNYVAANLFLDQLAHFRQLKGMAAVAINWGNIGEVGLAAADLKRGERLKEQGMGVFMPKDIPGILDSLSSQKGAQYMIMDIDFEQWAKTNSSILQNNFYSALVKMNTEVAEKEDVKSFPNMAAALRYLKGTIKQHISAITKVPVNKVKEDATFKSMGIDSLMAVQLKNKFQSEFELSLAVSSIWTYPTVEKYAEFIAEELKLAEQFSAPATSLVAPSVEKSVDEMSLEELMRELEEKSK